ncbi:MAG: metallophosphoesterase [Methanomicrobiaceae archaeon]|nr:metallophosphoesterase [Methanomicrobiaceae archaeon]
MSVTDRPVENEASRYRLDLRLGIPRSIVTGSLEWWLGDPGLCNAPDQHPYLVLAEISGEEWGNVEDIMQTISRCMEISGSILVSVHPTQGAGTVPEYSSYQIHPSPGLYSFVFLLSTICPIIADPGSLAYSMSRGSPTPFSTIPPLSSGDTLHSLEGTNKPICDQKEDARTIAKRERNHEPIPVEILRIVLRKQGYPVGEYDLARKEWLTISESNLRKNAKLSLRKFRIQKGYQVTTSMHRKNPQMFVVGDLHLGHENSIPRYKRPFLLSDSKEMDRVLIRNWNWTVKKEDTAIFLGDLAYKNSDSPESYLNRLNGRIFFIEGNHDPYFPYMSHCLQMRYKGIPFLFIHDPEEVNRPFEGWVIHGHVHNKDIIQYPFFNPDTRMVNVSVEMIGYRPISLDVIHTLVTGTEEVIPIHDPLLIR